MASRMKKLQLWKEKMNKNTIKDKIINCVDKLYSKDKYLFDCKVCERCLMFRLAYYLQVEFPKYFVDCEFNKMGFIGNKNQDKIEPNSLGDGLKRMFADIIIHKRNSNTEDNFICLEIKRTKRGLNNDLKRLKNMTATTGFRYEETNYIYAYDLGFLIFLPRNRNKSDVIIFENGNEYQKIQAVLR